MSDVNKDPLWAIFSERDEWGTSFDLVRSIEEAGLRLCTPAERKVLDAMAAGEPFWVKSMAETVEGPAAWADWFRNVLNAELARRAEATP